LFETTATVTSGSGASGGSGPTGSTTSMSTTGSGGAGAGGAGSGGAIPSACAAAVRAATESGKLLWTTLDDLASVTSPMSGNGSAAQVQTTPAEDFVPALSNNGVRLDADDERVAFRQGGNINPQTGAIDFCYQPAANHTDDANHPFFGIVLASTTMQIPFLRLRKAANNNANALQLIASNGNAFMQWEIPGTAYTMNAGTWYRVTASWTFMGGSTAEAHVYLDGAELVPPNPPTGPLQMPPADAGGSLFVGAIQGQAWHAGGIIDEVVIYDHPIVP
jgi:hypothetical protein